MRAVPANETVLKGRSKSAVDFQMASHGTPAAIALQMHRCHAGRWYGQKDRAPLELSIVQPATPLIRTLARVLIPVAVGVWLVAACGDATPGPRTATTAVVVVAPTPPPPTSPTPTSVAPASPSPQVTIPTTTATAPAASPAATPVPPTIQGTPTPPSTPLSPTPEPTAPFPGTPASGSATPAPGGIRAVTLPTGADDLPGVEQRVTLLLLGIDQADSFEGNTDVIMLVSLDPESGSAFVLSIPRDLCLEACDTHSSRINEIYKRQGMEALQSTLHNITGLPIDYFLLVNFYGVERIIDALGGVNVWSPREFDERFVYLDTDEEIRLVLEPGLNTLNGREAVAYGRSRKYDPAGDFARICRQQQVMRGLRDQALSPALVVNIPAVIEEVGGAFRTDFPLERLPSLAELALRTPAQRVHSFAIHGGGGELLQWMTGDDGAFLLRPDLVAIRDFVADAFARSLGSPTNAAGEPAFIADNCEAYYPS